MNRLDLFYRYMWDEEQRFVQTMTTEPADRWMRHLAKRDIKESTKCHYQNAVKLLFKWQREAWNCDVEWGPEIEYSDPSTNYQPRDYLTDQDRRRLRQAAMDYGTIPHYNSVPQEEGHRWNAYLAQRFQTPKDQISKQDWNRANSFKFISMIHILLDVGLCPIEILHDCQMRRH